MPDYLNEIDYASGDASGWRPPEIEPAPGPSPEELKRQVAAADEERRRKAAEKAAREAKEAQKRAAEEESLTLLNERWEKASPEERERILHEPDWETEDHVSAEVQRRSLGQWGGTALSRKELLAEMRDGGTQLRCIADPRARNAALGWLRDQPGDFDQNLNRLQLAIYYVTMRRGDGAGKLEDIPFFWQNIDQASETYFGEPKEWKAAHAEVVRTLKGEGSQWGRTDMLRDQATVGMAGVVKALGAMWGAALGLRNMAQVSMFGGRVPDWEDLGEAFMHGYREVRPLMEKSNEHIQEAQEAAALPADWVMDTWKNGSASDMAWNTMGALVAYAPQLAVQIAMSAYNPMAVWAFFSAGAFEDSLESHPEAPLWKHGVYAAGVGTANTVLWQYVGMQTLQGKIGGAVLKRMSPGVARTVAGYMLAGIFNAGEQAAENSAGNAVAAALGLGEWGDVWSGSRESAVVGFFSAFLMHGFGTYKARRAAIQTRQAAEMEVARIRGKENAATELEKMEAAVLEHALDLDDEGLFKVMAAQAAQQAIRERGRALVEAMERKVSAVGSRDDMLEFLRVKAQFETDEAAAAMADVFQLAAMVEKLGKGASMEAAPNAEAARAAQAAEAVRDSANEVLATQNEVNAEAESAAAKTEAESEAASQEIVDGEKSAREVANQKFADGESEIRAAEAQKAESEAEEAEDDVAIRRDKDGRFLPNPDASDMVKQAGVAAIERQRTLVANKVRIDSDETIAAAMRIMENVKGVVVHCVTSADSMSQDVRQMASTIARGADNVRAWVDPETHHVYLRVDKVGASEVASLLFSHEIVGHLGLRAYFGQDYDAFLDRVFQSHADDAEMAQVMSKYKYDRNTESGRRALAEEFLAHWAEARGVEKPAWYKSVVASIRTWLGKIFPSLRVTDAEIENALARSAEFTRNGGLAETAETSSEHSYRLAVDEGPVATEQEMAARYAKNEGLRVLSEFAAGREPVIVRNEQVKVTFPWGKTGDDGFGLFHIIEQRMMLDDCNFAEAVAVAARVAMAVAVGQEAGRQANKQLYEYDGVRAVVALNPNSNKFVITGYELDDNASTRKEARMANAKRYAHRKTYVLNHLSRKEEVVASLQKALKRIERRNTITDIPSSAIYTDYIKQKMAQDPASSGIRLSAESSEARASREYAEVEARFKGTDKWMKAPNGAETRLSERQWVQVRTPSFKEWFGDWEADPANASKILDENGEPLVLYHGSSKWFTAFNEGGQHQSGAPDGSIFMSDNREIANSFVAGNWYGLSDGMQSRQSPDVVLDPNSPLHRRYRWGVDREGGIYPLFANMRNPLVVDFNGETWQNGPGGKDINQIVRDAQGQGKDGVIAKDIRDVGAVDANVEVPASTVFVTFKPNQVKSATENIGTFDGRNNDIRFALGSAYSELDQRGMVAALRMYCTSRFHPDRGADYFALLRRLGFEPYCEADALEFAEQACALNRQERQERLARAREDWLSQKYQILQEVLEYTGKTLSTLKLKPSHEYLGEEFNSSFVDRAFDEYAHSKDKGRKIRAKVLNAEGAATDEVAQAIAERRGVGDARAVEEEIVEFVRNRSLKDLYKEYADERAEEKILSREQAARAREEAEASARYRAAEDAEAVLAEKREVTAEFARENPLAWEQVWRQVVGEGEAPANPGEAELAVVNSAVQSEGFNPADLVSRLQAQRERMRDDYLKRLSTIREALRADKADALALQRAALDFAREHLEAGAREEFARSIVNLAQYSNSPSAVHPEGRRVFEFNRIVARMLEASAEGRRSARIEEMRGMLEAARMRRNHRGIPVSVLPSAQADADRIRQILDLDPAAVAAAYAANGEELARLVSEEADPEGARMQALARDNALLEMFGDLAYRPAEAAEKASRSLEELLRRGRAEWRERLEARLEGLERMRSKAVTEITGGERTLSDRDADRHSRFMLQNQNLESLLRLAFADADVKFEDTEGGRMWSRVEDATWDEQTRLRRLQEEFDRALKEICHADGLLARGRLLSDVHREVERTGVFRRVYTRVNDDAGGGKLTFVGRHGAVRTWIHVEDRVVDGKTVPGARTLLRLADEGKSAADLSMLREEWGRLTPASLEWLRQQVADRDAGVEARHDMFGDELDDAAYALMLKESEDGAKVQLIADSPKTEFQEVEAKLSKGQALQLLLTWEQKAYRPGMEWNGWTERSMEQIRAFVGPELVQMARWMRDFIAKSRPALDAVVAERFGAHLPVNENYWPGVFQSEKGGGVGMGRKAGTMELNPGFLVARRFHLKPVAADADAFSVFLGNQVEQAHLLSWNDTMRDAQALFGNRTVKQALENRQGKALVEQLLDRLTTLKQGGSSARMPKALTALYRHWVPAKIALNVSSWLKQMCGMASFMNGMPVGPFLKYVAQANFLSPEFREFKAWALQSDYFRNRLGGGLDRDLNYLLNPTRDSASPSALSSALVEASSRGTRLADAWAVLHGGFAVYQYTLEQARASGMAEHEAKRAAERAWARLADATQQSGYLKDLNFYQANQGAWRYLTAFLTSPIQNMQHELRAFADIAKGKGLNYSKSDLARIVLVNHIVTPTLMWAVSSMLSKGLDPQEWDLGDLLTGWGLGTFEGVFIIGKALRAAVEWARSGFSESPKPVSALPALDDVYSDGKVVGNLLDDGKELTEDDFWRALRFGGDALMLGGAPLPALGDAGMLMHAVGTQGRRVSRIVQGDEYDGGGSGRGRSGRSPRRGNNKRGKVR